MKKKLLLSIFTALMLSSYAAKWPVLSRDAHGGGFFGYKDTKGQLGSVTGANGQVHTGWIITCENPGFDGCPKLGDVLRPSLPSNFDDVEYQKCIELENYVFGQVTGGVNTGVRNINVLVTGENFIRHYEITWDFTNGKESYNITREDITI